MKKTKIQNIILYIINFILIGFIIISNKGLILNNNRITLKNMSESTQVSDLNKSINELEASHEEYQNYIQTKKTELATAITNAGVTTSGNDTFETITTNVSKILENKTNDATAAAGEILTGKTAYVKGTKITGTMQDRGELNWNPNTSTSYTVLEGYYSGGTISTSNAYNAGYNIGENNSIKGWIKTGNQSYSGTSKTFTVSCTDYPNYKNITKDNIKVGLTSVYTTYNWSNATSTISVSNYDSSTGNITLLIKHSNDSGMTCSCNYIVCIIP